MNTLLVAEDERTLREGIAAAFRDRGWHVLEAADGGEAAAQLRDRVVPVLITDYRMPVLNGLELLRECRRISEETAVILLTAYGTVDSAVEAMREGAFDYLQKPFNLDELEMKVERALQHRRILTKLAISGADEPDPAAEEMIGTSRSMRQVFRTIRRVASSNSTVLILGETGTGKELVARALHRGSERRQRPFVRVNCAALPEGLLESELFGHERGAFTGADRRRVGRFELAHEGTLFLDEVGNMTAPTQAKLLRVLQEKEFERVGGTRTIRVDVRLVAATNRNLQQAVAEGDFRDDLFYRLNVITIPLPALRERPEDIELLTRRFAARFTTEMRRGSMEITPGALEALRRHHWPGNVRELENAIERAVLVGEGPGIRPEDLGLPGAPGPPDAADRRIEMQLPAAGTSLETLEKCAILEALRINGWVQKEAARYLGITPRTLNYKVSKHGITSPRWIKNRPA